MQYLLRILHKKKQKQKHQQNLIISIAKVLIISTIYLKIKT
jgi:hypothetical protein